MDAPDDDSDIKLQKISGDFIEDFDKSLGPFLRKPDGQLRFRVRIRETVRLTATLLDPFQELPQLLDPHLSRWLPLLASSYLEHLRTQSGRRTKPSEVTTPRSQLLEPLSAAICKLLYTFAKIRGPSVVLRFLPVEARYLEPLLSALESAEVRAARPSLLAVTDSSRAKAAAVEPSQREWTWEERYIVLLWLSYQLLAPFDLATISSAESEETPALSLPRFQWPPDLPSIAVRILPLAIKYLASPGKERDGAKEVLVRLAMRRDMQKLGVLDALVGWSLASLRPDEDEASEQPYFYIGVLSFLAGVLRSSVNTSDMSKHLSAISDAAHAVSSEEGNTLSEAVRSYAVARKMVIKVIRSVAILALQQATPSMAETGIVEGSIGYLLEHLADNDTPVRFAASKALSVITLKLDPDMAEQVVEAVLESLNRNVLWVKAPNMAAGKPTRDLTAVDSLEWHGLMLTLSHLLFRRSPPARQLPDIVQGLLLGLSFEKRSTSGGSTGSNVRDAACFGIWALARRYTTKELLAVSTDTILAAKKHGTNDSVIQVLATELLVTALLDSAGNIRRGASAALQELVGRHPDTVEKGIWVVQTVDYHAVALRSRAIQEVASKATRLYSGYGHALLDGLMGWRGIGDPDATARRIAAASFGNLTHELSIVGSPGARGRQFQNSIQMILGRLGTLQTRQVDERHGLLLCFAAVLDKLPRYINEGDSAKEGPEATRSMLLNIVKELSSILRDIKDITYRRPELIAESANRLIVSSLPVLLAVCLDQKTGAGTSLASLELAAGFEVVAPGRPHSLLQLVSALEADAGNLKKVGDLVSNSILPVVTTGLSRTEKEVISAASEAALVLLAFSPPAQREKIIGQWADEIRHRPASKSAQGNGYFVALMTASPLVGSASGDHGGDGHVAIDAVLARWAKDSHIETRVAILQSLTQSVVLQNAPASFLGILADGLNDYTTNARGDVGSLVRLEALRATKCLWRSLGAETGVGGGGGVLQGSVSKLVFSVLRLSAEKLDRVRIEAQAVVALLLLPSYTKEFVHSSPSSKAYFSSLLRLLDSSTTTGSGLHSVVTEVANSDRETWMAELLAGYVTSADTGNEDLVISSRAALTDFCAEDRANLSSVCTALARNLSSRQGIDRVLVPTLEMVAFLCHVGLFQACKEVDLKRLCLLVQKSGYKTGNVRKLEACIRVYGCVAAMVEETNTELPDSEEEPSPRREAGVKEARKRLGALMLHPWPRVRSLVVDELWRLFCEEEVGGLLKGVDWGRAEKGDIRGMVSRLGLE